MPSIKNILDYKPRFQFGQNSAPCGGKSCCTDTCIQMIVEYYTDKWYPLDIIRYKAQNKYKFDERDCTGLNYLEVLNALRQLGVTHYKVGFGASAADVWTHLDKGPVIIGVHYGSYPNDKKGTNKAEWNGRTDYPFTGSHAVLAVGKRVHQNPTGKHRDVFVRDPDHNSPSRPEKPRFDIIRRSQLQHAMDKLASNTAFTTTYILYPTKKK